MAVRFQGGKAVPMQKGGKLPSPDYALRSAMHDAAAGLRTARQALAKGAQQNPGNPKAAQAAKLMADAFAQFDRAWNAVSATYNWD